MIGVYQGKGLNYFNLVRNTLETYLDRHACNAGTFKIPEGAYNPLRQQYSAPVIIKYIAALDKQYDMKIGIIDVDIYTHGMNFIFGLADPVYKTSLVSTYRLTGESRDQRLSKEVVHEIGHLLNLSHCSRRNCVMYFSNTVDDTDRKCIELCEECRRSIESK
jgi:archaemetzincin